MDESKEDLEVFRLKQSIMADISEYNYRLNNLKALRKAKHGMSEISRNDYKFLKLVEE